MKRITCGGMFMDPAKNWFLTEDLSPNTKKFYGFLLDSFCESHVVIYEGKPRKKELKEKLGFEPEDTKAAIEELIRNGNLSRLSESTLYFTVHQDQMSDILDSLSDQELKNYVNKRFGTNI